MRDLCLWGMLFSSYLSLCYLCMILVSGLCGYVMVSGEVVLWLQFLKEMYRLNIISSLSAWWNSLLKSFLPCPNVSWISIMPFSYSLRTLQQYIYIITLQSFVDIGFLHFISTCYKCQNILVFVLHSYLFIKSQESVFYIY